MKTLLALAILIPFSVNALAVDQYESVITVTNLPSNGATISVNGDVRTWTTNAIPNSTQIAISTNGVNICTNSANLFRAFASNMPTGNVYLATVTTNAFKLFAQAGTGMTVTESAGWGTATTTTNAVVTAYSVRVPITSEPSASQRTNVANWLVSAINSFAVTPLSLSVLPTSYPTFTVATNVINVLTVNGTNYTAGIVNAIDENGATNKVLKVTP